MILTSRFFCGNDANKQERNMYIQPFKISTTSMAATVKSALFGIVIAQLTVC